MNVTIYHNPRCSKSRATLELLRARGIDPTVIEYLKAPPSVADLDRLLKLLDRQPRELMRRGETAYGENGLDDPALSHDALLKAMHEHPVLIERPIVVADGQARIGRPPDAVLEIIS